MQQKKYFVLRILTRSQPACFDSFVYKLTDFRESAEKNTVSSASGRCQAVKSIGNVALALHGSNGTIFTPEHFLLPLKIKFKVRRILKRLFVYTSNCS